MTQALKALELFTRTYKHEKKAEHACRGDC
jgi:hypothetical protein